VARKPKKEKKRVSKRIMDPKRRESVFTESVYLKRIAELFILPLLRYCPKNRSLEDFLEFLFCVDTRTIKRYTVIKPFRMPGSLKINENTLRNFDGVREVKKGIEIWVRYDTTRPRIYEMEVVGPKKKSQLFLVGRDKAPLLIHNHLKECPLKAGRIRRLSWDSL